MAPLTLCGSQSVAAINSFTVAPSLRPIRSRIVAVLQDARGCLAGGAPSRRRASALSRRNGAPITLSSCRGKRW